MLHSPTTTEPSVLDTPVELYPLGIPTTPGQLHLRTCGELSRSHRMDLAAVLTEARAQNQRSIVLGANQHHLDEIVSVFGERFRGDDLVQTVQCASLLEATATLYRHAMGSTPLLVVIGDLQELSTPGIDGHDDAEAVAWLRAVLTSDDAALFALTGVHRATMLRDADPAPMAPISVVAGVRQRRGSGDSLRRLMGGSPLVALADTLCELGRAELDETGVVAALGTWRKHRFEVTGEPVVLERSLRGAEAWRARH